LYFVGAFRFYIPRFDGLPRFSAKLRRRAAALSDMKSVNAFVTFRAARDLLPMQWRFRPSPAKPTRPLVQPGDLVFWNDDYELSLLPVFAAVRHSARRKTQSKHANEPIQSTVS
jgi:hypothetical protein